MHVRKKIIAYVSLIGCKSFTSEHIITIKGVINDLVFSRRCSVKIQFKGGIFENNLIEIDRTNEKMHNAESSRSVQLLDLQHNTPPLFHVSHELVV